MGLGEREKRPQAGRKWNKRAKMENRKKSDGRKGKGDMAAVDDLYHRRLLGTIQSTISARNAEQEPAGRYRQLLIFVRAQIRGGSGVSRRCMFDMAL